MHYKGTPLWSFGDGLGYAKLHLEWMDQPQTGRSISIPQLVASNESQFKVRVSNLGTTPSDGSVLLGFVTSSEPKFPKQKLFAFARSVSLAPNESQVVVLQGLTADILAVADHRGRRVVHPAALSIRIGMQDQWLELEYELVGQPTLFEDLSAHFE